MPGMGQILTVGAGGAIGAVCRFFLQYCFANASHRQWIVVAINLAGCALIGVAWALVDKYGSSTWLNQGIIAGILGGFTTYSTFAWDSFDLVRNGRSLEAGLYVAVTIIGGFLLCALAYTATEKLLK